MPLQKQPININFAQGLDTKTDPKQVQIGKFEFLVNMVFTNQGLLQKRNGFQLLPSAATSGNAIAPYFNELLTLDGSSLWSLSDEQSTSLNKGTKVSVDLSVQAITRNFYQQTNPDSASTNNLSVFAWLDSSGGIRYSVQDVLTNQFIVSNALVDSNGTSPPKVKVIGTHIVILYVNNSNALGYKAISVSTPQSIGSFVSLGTTGSAQHYDAQVFNSRLYVAYSDNSNKLSIFYLDTSLTQSSVLQENLASKVVSIWGDASNNVWVAFSLSTSIRYIIANAALGSLVLASTLIESTSTTIENITGIYNGTNSLVYYELQNAGTNSIVGSNVINTGNTDYNEYVRNATLSVGGTVTGVGDFIRSVGIATKAFIFNSTVYIGLVHSSTLQKTYFVANSSGTVITKVAPSNGGGLITGGVLPEVNTVTSNIYQFPYLFQDTLAAQTGKIFTETGVNSATLTFGNQTQALTIANDIHFSGGVLSMYDGNSIAEHGFNLYPENVQLFTGYAGGGLGIGSYQYVAVYEWEDNQGNIHRSAPSVPVTFNNTAGSLHFSGIIPDNRPAIPLMTIVPTNPAPVAPGMTITSPVVSLVPADTYVTIYSGTDVVVSNTLGMPEASPVEFVLTPNINIIANTTSGSATIQVPAQEPDFFVVGNYVAPPGNSTTTLTVANSAGLRIGMIMTPVDFPSLQFQILSITGNQLSVWCVNPEGITLTKIGASFQCEMFINFTANGTSTLSSVTISTITGYPNSIPLDQALFKGQVIDATVSSPLVTAGTTITAINAGAGTLTISAPATGSGTGLQLVDTFVAYHLVVGQLITSADATTVPVGSQIASISVVTSPTVYTVPTITLITPQVATATETGIILQSSEIITNVLQVPTLRITNKPASTPISIVIYRTVANGTTFYRISSLTDITLNSTTTDYVTIFDGIPDTQIIGNELLYTTGGVVDDIAAPATSIMTTYRSRMFIVDAEVPNLLWYSKQVLQTTPVEFSDLFTVYVPPTVAAQPNASPVTALSVMDDKLIIFKRDAIYYMTGTGPDNTDANNDFSDPTYIISAVGCANPNSIVSMPSGLMFQSAGKGIWLLGRDLSTSYIGAPVESNNAANVTSASNVPGTNQCRFTLDNGVTLMYDYYYQQWGTFNNPQAVSGTIYKELHTYLASNGDVYQENIGSYVDNTTPVLLNFKTAWISVAGLQGYERLYYMLLLGEYFSPFTLTANLYYDYSTTYLPQTITLTPDGTTPFQFRLFPQKQKCETFQLAIQENYGGSPGQGLSMSGIDMMVGIKKGARPIAANYNFG